MYFHNDVGTERAERQPCRDDTATSIGAERRRNDNQPDELRRRVAYLVGGGWQVRYGDVLQVILYQSIKCFNL